jgi:hypothetical protein
VPQESILLLYISASSSKGDLSKQALFPSTSCLTSEIAPADVESPPPDNMSDVSVPSMSALTVHGASISSGEGTYLGPNKSSMEGADSILLPEDLVHLTRRILFLVVDSDNSSSFMRLQVGMDELQREPFTGGGEGGAGGGGKGGRASEGDRGRSEWLACNWLAGKSWEWWLMAVVLHRHFLSRGLQFAAAHLPCLLLGCCLHCAGAGDWSAGLLHDVSNTAAV